MPYLRVICFMIIFFLLVSNAQYMLQYRERHQDNSSFQVINFYKEKKNSADAVFVGSSCCFSFYSPLFAYENYGIRTINYSSSGMGMLAYRYAIEEVRKKQKDVPIILTITTNDAMEYLGVHFMSDYMPMSKNKVAFLSRYFTVDGESILNSIGFYATIMEYHDRWSEMKEDDFIIDEGIKGATHHKYYLSNVYDVSDLYLVTDEKEELSHRMERDMEDLLEYCDERNENVVFLLPPKVYDEEEYAQLNTLCDLISSKGYEVLDLRDSCAEIGLLPEEDFYDPSHTGIHGSIKYTDYLARYIMEHFDTSFVEDGKWDQAVAKYRDIIDDYVLDVETDMKQRDYFLGKPELLSLKQNGKNTLLEWEAVEGADNYIVYRKDKVGFERIGETTDLSFTDEGLSAGTYTYTVLSSRQENGKQFFGNYDYKGLAVEVKE